MSDKEAEQAERNRLLREDYKRRLDPSAPEREPSLDETEETESFNEEVERRMREERSKQG